MKFNSVFKVTAAYLLFGLLWIYLSDRLLNTFLVNNPELLLQVQTLKGFFYVGFTAALLFFLVKKYSTALQQKIELLQASEHELIQSEEKYKLLFDASPMPVFIYQPETDKILDVNYAAVGWYGYSPEEFSTMTILEIEYDENVQLLEEKLSIPKRDGMSHSTGIHRHKKKNGEYIYVYTQGSVIEYNGVPAQLIMANDITYQLRYIDAIEKQNEKLNKIAWMQSHVVRAPLASLMGLVHLLHDENIPKELKELTAKILSTANELDGVIRDISGEADILAGA